MAVDEELLRKVQDLGDLDLAVLLCLISREHCIVSTEPPSLDDLVAELQLVASRSFNLTSVVVDCTPQTTLDDLALSIQLPSPGATNATTPRSTSPLRSRNDTYFPYQQQQQQQQRLGRSNSIASSTTHHHHLHGSHAHGHGTSSRAAPMPLRALTPIAAATATTTAASPNINNNNSNATPTPQIANVILAKNLDRAPKAVQIQCLELLRTRRLFTRTSVQTAPKQFLFVAVLGADSIGGGGGGRLTKHLNDLFYIAHWHDPEDGFVHLEEQEEEEQEEAEAAAAAMSGGGHDDEADYENETGGAYDDDASMQSDESVVRRPQSRSTTTAARTSTPTSTMKTDAWGSGGGGGYRDSASARSLWKEKSTINSTTSNTYYSAANNNNNNNNPLLLSPKAELIIPHPPPPSSSPLPPSLFRAESDIPALALAASSVAVDIEVLRYQMNVISFLRMHRAVAYAGGVGPLATRHMSQLVRCLAALHGLDYATPSLVGLAARKVYPHRLRLVADFERGKGEEGEGERGGAGGGAGMSSLEHERSVQWGSDLSAVEALLEGVGPQDVIDDVLGMVAAPL
ncbi:hypothetical protein F4809DRAFT_611810 [Biscogniauxia mediterranea]|nr:hypothetical protein F4809DRAFT_611810 [Biscogniauxia mediterranea]